MIPEKPLEPLAACLVGRHGKALVRSESRFLEGSPSEEEDEADVTLLEQKVGPVVCSSWLR